MFSPQDLTFKANFILHLRNQGHVFTARRLKYGIIYRPWLGFPEALLLWTLSFIVMQDVLPSLCFIFCPQTKAKK